MMAKFRAKKFTGVIEKKVPWVKDFNNKQLPVNLAILNHNRKNLIKALMKDKKMSAYDIEESQRQSSLDIN
jgi:hypothetical protein